MLSFVLTTVWELGLAVPSEHSNNAFLELRRAYLMRQKTRAKGKFP